MGKKYIIELIDDCRSEFKGIIAFDVTPESQIAVEPIPAEEITPYTAPDLEQVRKEGYEKGWKEAEDHYFDGYSNGYDAGLDDAWKAAKKIWEYDTTTLREIFGEGIMRMDWFMKFTAAEAMEKIWQYEQKKEEIKVGDEVATDAGNRASVLYENPDGTQVFVFKSDGTAAWWTKSALHRTGRNFPEIAAVLEKMRGEQDG